MGSITIALLAGDGIGPEVMAEAKRVLAAVADKFGHPFNFQTGLVGGAAFEETGKHLPQETLRLCEASEAILFGSVGGPLSQSHLPKWQACEVNSILALRKRFMFFVNLRPIQVSRDLCGSSALKEERIKKGIDLLIVRELLGDLYFGRHERKVKFKRRIARDVAQYDEDQIRAAAHVAFRAAKERRGKVTSVDKANVLETSRLWREVVQEVGSDYPTVALENMLVDNCAMQLVKDPAIFDVILTTNMFGDILSDLASALPGSLGLIPSASLGENRFGLYEPAGGSAPDLAGQNKANPIGQILSAAMMLRYSLQLHREASAIESAIMKSLHEGFRTPDLFVPGMVLVGTREMGDAILSRLE